MSGPRYKLLVFDWDGTLIDSIGTIVGCTQATLAELELPKADEAVLRAAIGLGIHDMVESFCPGCSEATFGRIVEVYRRLWIETYGARSNLFEGVPDLLEALSGDGRLLAIATAKNRRGLARDLERTGLADAFHASRTVDEAASKPSPDMLLGLLNELGVRPDEALMIGDSVHDLEMASNAGVEAVGVASGTTTRERLERDRPLACLERVVDLAAWLEQEGSGS